MEADRDQPPGHLLGGGGERLLALALAEVELRRRADGDLDDAVGQLPRRQLVEPDAVEARVLASDDVEDFLPGGRIETARAAAELARRETGSRATGEWVVSMAMKDLTATNEA